MEAAKDRLVELHSLLDGQRNREILYAYYPALGTPRAQVVFSVGFGGERNGYGFLAKAWQSTGLDVFVLEHSGSNLQRLKEIKAVPPRPRNQTEWAQRVGLEVLRSEDVLQRPFDLSLLCLKAAQRKFDLPLFLGGHSFGAFTCMAALGVTILDHRQQQPRRLRLKPQIKPQKLLLMSGQPGQTPDGQRLSIWEAKGLESIDCSSLLMTGTLDFGMPAGTTVAERLRSFAQFPSANRKIALLDGADHMSFAGVALNQAQVLDQIAAITTEYFSDQTNWESLKASAGHTLWDEKALDYANQSV
jgi:predicted dienelactone hydrolase